jgi:hypothetical protein
MVSREAGVQNPGMKRLLAAFAVAWLLTFSHHPALSDDRKTFKGQVVCGSCWDEVADRHKERYGTKEDLACAARCERKGVAAALAVENAKDFTIYELARGSFKPEGRGWLAYMGKEVEVTGRVETKGGKGPKLVVDALRVLEK